MQKTVEYQEILEYGSNILALCTANGLTQEKASEKFLLSPRHLNNIVHNSARVTIETLGRIARELGVAPAALGVLHWSDEQILALLRKSPGLPGYTGKPLDIFRNILLLRKFYKLTQPELSELSKISVATIRNIEHGCANISISTLICIAAAFDTSLLKLAVLTTPPSDFLILCRKSRTAGVSPAAQLLL